MTGIHEMTAEDLKKFYKIIEEIETDSEDVAYLAHFDCLHTNPALECVNLQIIVDIAKYYSNQFHI